MNAYLPEKGYKRILVLAVYLLAGGFLLYLALKYLLGALLPFLLAWASAAILRPIVSAIRKKTNMTQRAAGFFVLFLLLAAIGGGVFFLIYTVISQAGELLHVLSENADELGKELGGLLDRIIDHLPLSSFTDRDAWRTAIRGAIGESLGTILSFFTASLPRWVGFVLSSIPGAILFLTVYLISAFALCTRYEALGAQILSFLPPLGQQIVAIAKKQIARMSFTYLRAALILLLITFFELYLGFFLLGVPYALLLAVLIAVIDLLPILGVGTVILPWSLFCLLTHRFRLGVGLLILFVVLTVVRQIIEPRIVGKAMGLSPFVTITVMYAGWHLFGIVGLILLPAALNLILLLFRPEKRD